MPGIIEDYKPLEAPLITTSLLTDPNIDLDWDYPAEGINSWMEKRYKDLVSDEVLNQNGENDNKILIGEADQSEELITSLQGHYNEVDISTNHFLIVDKDTFWEFNVFGKSLYKRSIELKSADPSKFGTENEILREQRWFARYNQASIVNYAAQQEFIKRKSEILDWVKERIYKNLDFLYQSIAQGELKIIKPKKNNSKYIFIKDNIFSMCMSNSKDYNQIKTWSSEFQICDRKEEYTNNYYCKKNGTLATLKAIFSPEVPLDLAVLCGCKVEELPDLLQVWSAHEETSSHNSILDRIDPMDWLPKNPWIKLNLNIVIHLSKRGYTQICKSHNAKPHRFWKEDNV